MTYRIALIGYGNIGQGFLRSLANDRAQLEARCGHALEIAAVVCRQPDRQRKVPTPAGALLTSDWKAVLDDGSIDGIVEVIGVDNDGKPDQAHQIAVAALSAGKDFITANKALIATHGGELHTIARTKGAMLLYEASVGAGIPLIASLQGALLPNRVRALHGILNGTCNYIMTRIEEESSLTMAAAIKEAQDLGYAEPDPRSDVEGEDAAYKLSIVASLCFGQRFTVDHIHQLGITTLAGEESDLARMNGWALKLIAAARETPDGLSLSVAPTFLPERHILAAARGGFNGLLVGGDPIGETFLYGPGAGQPSTASGLLADVLLAARNKGVGAARLLPLEIPSDEAPIPSGRESVYLRIRTKQHKGAVVATMGNTPVLYEGPDLIAYRTNPVSATELNNLIAELVGKGILRSDIAVVRYALGA